MLRVAVVATAVAQAGCFAEIGAGYYVSSKQTLTSSIGTDSADGGAVQVSAKVGLYFDIPIRPANTAVGLGWSPAPMGGDITNPSENSDLGFSATFNEFRADASLPFSLDDAGRVRARITAIFGLISGTSIELMGDDDGNEQETTSGRSWFVGPTIARYASFGTLAASVGVIRQSVLVEGERYGGSFESSATGVGGRLFFTWWPGGTVTFSGASAGSSGTGGKCPGGAYVDRCDVNGSNCRSEWVCP